MFFSVGTPAKIFSHLIEFICCSHKNNSFKESVLSRYSNDLRNLEICSSCKPIKMLKENIYFSTIFNVKVAELKVPRVDSRTKLSLCRLKITLDSRLLT